MYKSNETKKSERPAQGGNNVEKQRNKLSQCDPNKGNNQERPRATIWDALLGLCALSCAVLSVLCGELRA